MLQGMIMLERMNNIDTDVTPIARSVSSIFEGKQVFISPQILNDVFDTPNNGAGFSQRLRFLMSELGVKLARRKHAPTFEYASFEMPSENSQHLSRDSYDIIVATTLSADGAPTVLKLREATEDLSSQRTISPTKVMELRKRLGSEYKCPAWENYGPQFLPY